MAKVTVTFLVTVQGTRDFPIDMLRYDQAIPFSEQDSGMIAGSFVPHRSSMAVRTIRVSMPRQPTTGRWESFGWKVVYVEPRTFNS